MAARKPATKTTKPRAAGKRAPPRRKAAPAKEPKANRVPRTRSLATTRAVVPAPAEEALKTARLAAAAALDKKAEDVVVLDVRGLTSYADYFVIASGSSDRQVSAIADSIDDALRKAGSKPIGSEGYTGGHWILIDFGDVVAHVFYEEARGFYDLEGLWSDAARIPLA